MIASVAQVCILVLSIAIFPLQLYRSYKRFRGKGGAQKVVNETLFPLLILQSLLWYTYAAVTDQYFIAFTSTTNALCHMCIWYCITHTSDNIEVKTGSVIVAGAPEPARDDAAAARGSDSPAPWGSDSPAPWGSDSPAPWGSGYPQPRGSGYPQPRGSGSPAPWGSGYPQPRGSGYPQPRGSGPPAPWGSGYPQAPRGCGYPQRGAPAAYDSWAEHRAHASGSYADYTRAWRPYARDAATHGYYARLAGAGE